MTQSQLFSTGRSFQLWSYIVSHRQLLLRSTKSKVWTTRIDVLFKDVSLMHIGTKFEDFSVQEIPFEPNYFRSDNLSLTAGHKLFRLNAKNSLGYVSAATLQFFEDEKEYFEESFLVEPNHL